MQITFGDVLQEKVNKKCIKVSLGVVYYPLGNYYPVNALPQTKRKQTGKKIFYTLSYLFLIL